MFLKAKRSSFFLDLELLFEIKVLNSYYLNFFLLKVKKLTFSKTS